MTTADEVPVLTTELALRFESLMAPDVDSKPGGSDPSVPVLARFGRTIASKATTGRPVNDVHCFGRADLGRLDQILDFFDADGVAPSFYLAPMDFTADVAAALSRAGFAQRQFGQCVMFGRAHPAAPTWSAGLAIDRVTDEDVDEFAATTAAAFDWDPAWRDAAIATLKRGFRADQLHFVARSDGRPVGVGSIDVREGVATLKDSAVIRAMRGKGVHRLLLDFRRNLAHSLGCAWVLSAADFGSASFRNQQRSGLRLAYVESGWLRASAGASGSAD